VQSELVAHVAGQVPPAHTNSPHETPVGVAEQAPAPSHNSPFTELLAASQTVAPHEGRAPWGTPTIGVQVPSVPVASQAEHCAAQALLQQTPSAQIADTHSGPVVHAVPFAPFFVHTPLLQYASLVQSVLDAHEAGQTPPAHRKSPHATPVDVGAQAPEPLHSSPFTELLAVSHTLAPHEGRVPWGAPTMGVQVPSVPFASQAEHCPKHALLQQTPSAQIADTHSCPALHAAPFAPFLMHIPPLQ
jgi:hypothetical protein